MDEGGSFGNSTVVFVVVVLAAMIVAVTVVKW
jgi:hypothetical protein